MKKPFKKEHPGFQAVQRHIQQQAGVSAEAAGRILGYSNAHASAAAKKKNPRLTRRGGR